MGKLNSLMQIMVYPFYWLLFFKNNNLKHTAISQRILFNYFCLFLHFFLSSFTFLSSLFKLSCTKKPRVYNLCRISPTCSFCYVMFYIVLEICIDRFSLEDYFYRYSQQIIPAVAKESLIPYNLIQRAPETYNL